MPHFAPLLSIYDSCLPAACRVGRMKQYMSDESYRPEIILHCPQESGAGHYGDCTSVFLDSSRGILPFRVSLSIYL